VYWKINELPFRSKIVSRSSPKRVFAFKNVKEATSTGCFMCDDLMIMTMVVLIVKEVCWLWCGMVNYYCLKVCESMLVCSIGEKEREWLHLSRLY
jgi:hypothetical protein